MKQLKAKVTGKVPIGGGQKGQAGIYELTLEDGSVLMADYIEVATDGFKSIIVGDEVWCSISPEKQGWACYIVPIRDYSPLQYLGIEQIVEEPGKDEDPFIELWL